jgi:hypothetical protein
VIMKICVPTLMHVVVRMRGSLSEMQGHLYGAFDMCLRVFIGASGKNEAAACHKSARMHKVALGAVDHMQYAYLGIQT